ncbi:hypothetical protein VCSRO7_3434 [Vibrio cholerae]|nr:hypothetical protein VCSRO7_3434 [Vibrio cholerae]
MKNQPTKLVFFMPETSINYCLLKSFNNPSSNPSILFFSAFSHPIQNLCLTFQSNNQPRQVINIRRLPAFFMKSSGSFYKIFFLQALKSFPYSTYISINIIGDCVFRREWGLIPTKTLRAPIEYSSPLDLALRLAASQLKH